MKVLPPLFFMAATLSLLVTLSIFLFMIVLGLPLFREGSFLALLTQPWLPGQGIYGIFPMIAGTLCIALTGTLIAFPLSLGCAALITLYNENLFSRLLKRTVAVMTGIPTVIYGFIGVFLLVPFIRAVFQNGSGMCILTAAILVALLISPTMILIFYESFCQIPAKTCLAVDAMGGTAVQKFLYVILPGSVRGIATGVILATGRALGDTMIALMVAGNAVAMPGSLLDSARTLTAHIALVIAADFDSLEFKTLFLCGIVLYLFSAVTVIIVRILTSSQRRH